MCFLLANYRKKAVVSGSVIEIYEYENDVIYGYKDVKKSVKGRKSEASKEDKEINREKVCQRAERDLRRLINANYRKGESRFVTLTFKDNIQDLKWANREFSKFVMRWQYKLGYKLQYSAVVEFQKRGAIHYHCIFYNIPQKLDLPKLRDIWGYGSVNVKRIEHVDNVGAYMVKYMSKNSIDKRLEGQKMYFNSRGLIKPQEIKEPEVVEALAESLQNQVPKYENTFSNDYNSINYKQYIVSEVECQGGRLEA